MSAPNTAPWTGNIVPGKTTGRLKRRLAWLAIALFVGVVLLEIALRLATGLGNPVVYQADPACGYLPQPNQSTRRFGKLNSINAFGQRSEPLPAVKDARHERVLFIGDSFTYGTTYVDQADLFTARLAHSLPQRQGHPVDVMNASTGAWAVSNEVAYLTSRGTFDADTVIFVLNSGDFDQPFSVGDLKPQTGYPAERPATAIGELWVRYLRPRLFRQPAAQDAGSVASSNTVPPEAVRSSLDEARRFATEHHARFAIIYSPMHGPTWDTAAVKDNLAALTTWCRDRAVPFLDLTAAYGIDTPENVYFDNGTGHLRPRGHALTAEAVLAHWTELTRPRQAAATRH